MTTPALLANATWYGTLAALRDLGTRGVPVTLACDDVLAPARWSRFATRVARFPASQEPGPQLEFLHRFGDESPGHALYPTSDEMAWLVASDRAALGVKYRLYSPAPEALATLLDKGRLARAAEAAGLDTPRTWLPADEGELERLAAEAPWPLFVKSRTQLFSHRGKGWRVDRREDLLRVWRANRLSSAAELRLGPALQGAGTPLVQTCHAERESIFTVDGFVDRSGEMATLGCLKLLQLPRHLGPGIVFEGAPVPASVTVGLQRLFAQAGFYGVFDAEFVTDGERVLLIDVNPRFYNHMAFEIARGLPLAWLAYLGAVGDEARLSAALADARAHDPGDGWAYVHRLPLALLLAVQGVTGKLAGAERRRWRGWLRAPRGRVVDPASARGDRLPGLVDVAFQLEKFLRHPRAFLRDLRRGDGDPAGSRPPTR